MVFARDEEHVGSVLCMYTILKSSVCLPLTRSFLTSLASLLEAEEKKQQNTVDGYKTERSKVWATAFMR